MSSDQTEVLTAAGIAPERWGRQRLRTLSDGERQLYRWILRSFRSGAPLRRSALADAASALDLEAEPALATLSREDLVHHDSETGAVLVAYPFSGRPTAHQVRFEDGGEAFAMCAIDALGIAPMLGEPIEITSRDPLTDEEIRVAHEPEGRAGWQPYDAVVVCGATGKGESCSSCCPVLNFFASRDSATRWLASHPEVRGSVMTLADAIVAARTVFGDILEEG
jgi:hypothetical protein